MKKYVARILLIAMLLCAMVSLTSCVRSNVKSVSIHGETYYSGYLYAVQENNNQSVTWYVYSTEQVEVGDSIKIKDGKDATVTEVAKKYEIRVVEGVNLYTVTYYQSILSGTYTFVSLDAAMKKEPVKRTAEVAKENAIIYYYVTGGDQ